MDSDKAKFIGSLVSKALKDPLQSRQVTDKCLTFLTKVEIPSGWEEKSYKLDQSLPTYKYRLEILKKFIDKKKDEGSTVDSGTVLDELKQFLAETDDSFSESAQDQRREVEFDLFEQNIKLQGVVVRKSEKQLKASVLVKREDSSKQQSERGSGKFSEFVVALQGEDHPDEEFHLKVAIGDIVEVTKCRRQQGTAWELEVIQCLNLSEPEIEKFLNLLSSRLESDGSTATVIELTRCHAAWNYILELSKKKDSTERTCQILKIVYQICSSVPMSDTVSEIVRRFHRSVFFRLVLPDFIDDLTEKSFISMVQKILEHVITVCPASGLQVLPMATALAHKLVKTSSDLPMALDNGQSAVNFLAKLSRITASNVPGACQDLKDLSWKELPLIPMAEEIKKPRIYKIDDLPAIKKEGQYKSEEEYLNTHYRLLREECFYKLRKGIYDFVKESGQKSDSTDMMMYRVWLRGASLRHENSPTVMAISLEYETPQTQASSEVDNTGCLLFGSLLCISLDGSFQEPIWAVVDKHIHEQRIITVTLCDKANTMNEPQFICKMQEITNKSEKAFMAESQTFYVSFAPAMEVLQQREHVPFKEFLVYPNPKQDYSNLEPAEYIDKVTTPPDWGIIFKRDSLFERSDSGESSAEYSLLRDFDAVRLGCKSILDETQLKAVELALKHKLALIQGPPGTGKSFVGVALVRLLLSMNVRQDHGPVLVVTYKNHALDNFLRELRKVSPHTAKIVRVGRLADEDDENLKKCLLRQVGGSWPEKLFEQKRKVMRQIWALQSEVREAFDKLRSSSIFNADMFIQEASKDQLKDLLVAHKKQKVAKGDVVALVDELPSTKAQVKVRKLVENALEDWLPPQKKFDCFESKKKSSSQEKSSSESAQKKDDDDQSENPNDFKDPALEQRERDLVIDEEVADKEDEDIAKTEPSGLECSSLPPYLRRLVCKDESEVEHYMDVLDSSGVWNLSYDKRAQLVYVFQSKFFSKASSAFQEVNKRYSELQHQLQELKNQRDIEVMRRCDVIGMTVTGATMRANLLADIKPSVVVVEEAAEILEGQLVAVITPSVQHLILIGDHKQLKPVVHFNRLKKKNLDLSMFERLVECKLPLVQLRYQCRMRKEFVDLLHKLDIYEERLMTNEELVRKNDIPFGVSSCMYFWTHTNHETEHASHSKRNLREAEEITKVAKTFLQIGNVTPWKITVLCSYRGQVLEIKKRFYSATDVEALKDVTVTTIDAFQGQENDIILISLVRSNERGKIGYLSSRNRLCVAISRARCGLYLFGNHAHFAGASKRGWKVVSDSMRKDKCLGSRFPFGSREDSQPLRHTDSRIDGSSPSKETECVHGSHITIHTTDQTNVIIAGNRSVNTITTSPVIPPVASPPSGLHLPSLQSGRQPVHDPMSPLPGSRPPTVGGPPTHEAGSPTEEAGSPTKEARQPIQEFGQPSEEVVSPTLEVDPPPKEARDPIQEVGKPKQEAGSPRVEAGSLTEEASLPTKAASEPIQEVGKPITEVGSPTLDVVSLGSNEENNVKERPVQESASPGKCVDSVLETDNQPVQEESPQRQETMVAGKGALKETGEDEGTAVLETDTVSEPQGAHGDGTADVIQGKDVLQVEVSEGKSKQETGTLKGETKCSKEETHPSQETMAAGKGPFEETGDDVGKAVLETETTGELQSPEDTTEVMVGKDVSQELEDGSLEVGTESSKEEGLPSQETMPAGKGPFEETGDDVGKAVLETDTTGEPQSPEDTTEVTQTKDVPQEDVFGAEQKQEDVSLEVGTESSKEEGLPTQETMAAGKGPFEETGLEVGVKGHPTDG